MSWSTPSWLLLVLQLFCFSPVLFLNRWQPSNRQKHSRCTSAHPRQQPMLHYPALLSTLRHSWRQTRELSTGTEDNANRLLFNVAFHDMAKPLAIFVLRLTWSVGATQRLFHSCLGWQEGRKLWVHDKTETSHKRARISILEEEF